MKAILKDSKVSMDLICPVCKSSEISVFFEIFDIPVHVGVQWRSPKAAQDCPRGDIRLAFCRSCSFITNIAFDPNRLGYTQVYDNSLHFSPFFQKYAHSIATHLIERYDLHNKDIIEIGCGKGDFLLLLCELGNNRGVGFDPSYESQRVETHAAKLINVIPDFYSERHSNYQGDLICCRYVFEHIENPVDFLNMIRGNIGKRSNTVLYFEVPNVLYILRDLSIWDVIYEHCSYFSYHSFAYIFNSCRFDVCALYETYEGQYLGIEAVPNKKSGLSGNEHLDGLEEPNRLVAAFEDNYLRKLETWQADIKRIRDKGQKAVAWGAGAKGVSFLNMLKIQNEIEYIVDINPNKHGKFMPGTCQQIVGPDFLRDYKPDFVIVMNPIYKDEIQQIITDLGLTSELLIL